MPKWTEVKPLEKQKKKNNKNGHNLMHGRNENENVNYMHFWARICVNGYAT